MKSCLSVFCEFGLTEADNVIVAWLVFTLIVKQLASEMCT